MSKLEHAVQSADGNGDLGRTTPVGLRAQRIPDHSFQLAGGGLDQGPTSVPGPRLLTRASMLRHALEMLVALGKSAFCHVARHRR